jgi:putative heme iron utilization protein
MPPGHAKIQRRSAQLPSNLEHRRAAGASCTHVATDCRLGCDEDDARRNAVTYVLAVARDPNLADGLRESIGEILAGSTLFALATVGSDGSPHANTAFFAHDDALVASFVSERSARHSVNLAAEPRAMASVFLDPPRLRRTAARC